MGYTTYFTGAFDFNKPLDDGTYALLKGLSTTRRMKRKGLDPKYGIDGEFYFNPDSMEYGQEREESIVNYNEPPSTQPSLWCQWTPTDDRTQLVWNESEKFYEYVDWLVYLIENIIAPAGYVLNGEVNWEGEVNDDFGALIARNNKVLVREGVRSYKAEVEIN